MSVRTIFYNGYTLRPFAVLSIDGTWRGGFRIFLKTQPVKGMVVVSDQSRVTLFLSEIEALDGAETAARCYVDQRSSKERP